MWYLEQKTLIWNSNSLGYFMSRADKIRPPIRRMSLVSRKGEKIDNLLEYKQNNTVKQGNCALTILPFFRLTWGFFGGGGDVGGKTIVS